MKSHKRQGGLSSISILIILLVAVFFGTCAVKLIPVYLESFTVERAVSSVAEQAKGAMWGRTEIRSSLQKQFQVNRVEALKPQDVKVMRKDGKTTIDATYEKRVPLMFNIDAVVKFDQLIYEY